MTTSQSTRPGPSIQSAAPSALAPVRRGALAGAVAARSLIPILGQGLTTVATNGSTRDR